MRKYFSRILMVVLVLAALGIAYVYPLLYVTPVLMYHNIAEAKNEGERANSVSPASFRKQMEFLKKNKYRVLSMDQYIEAIREQKNMCCRSVAITFDDGLENNYTAALPVLEEFGYPSTFFVGISDIGDPTQMSWEQIKSAAKRGVTIGSHLMTEAYLPGITDSEQEYEISESKNFLEAKLGEPIKYLAYPIGGFKNNSKLLAQKAGYKAAFTTNRGVDRYNKDLFELNRLRVKDDDTALELSVKLSGFYNAIRKMKKSY